MLSTFLAYLNAYVIVGLVCFIVGVIFSQKVKDWIAGIPTNVRAELRKIEAEGISRVQAAQATAIQSVMHPVPTPAVEAPKV